MVSCRSAGRHLAPVTAIVSEIFSCSGLDIPRLAPTTWLRRAAWDGRTAWAAACDPPVVAGHSHSRACPCPCCVLLICWVSTTRPLPFYVRTYVRFDNCYCCSLHPAVAYRPGLHRPAAQSSRSRATSYRDVPGGVRLRLC